MSVHTQKYLFEAGLIDPFTSLYKCLQEMSDKALDILAPDEGLEVSKKSKLKGRLNSSEDWSVQKMEYLEGSHGEAEYETCENCTKSIRYVCHIQNAEGVEKIVGPDCALTLLPPGSEDAKAVEEYVGKRIKKNKFVKNAIKLLEEASGEADNAYLDMLKERFGAKDSDHLSVSFLNDRRNALKYVEDLIGVNNMNLNQAALKLSVLAAKKWILSLLSTPDGIKRLSLAFEKTWEDESATLRNKKYFFNPSNDNRKFISEFLEDFKDDLGGQQSIFRI